MTDTKNNLGENDASFIATLRRDLRPTIGFVAGIAIAAEETHRRTPRTNSQTGRTERKLEERLDGTGSAAVNGWSPSTRPNFLCKPSIWPNTRGPGPDHVHEGFENIGE
jgi:hypothetical protein